MSIHYVNEHLITEEIISEGVWSQTGEQYKRIMIKTTPDAVVKREDGTYVSDSRPICAHNCSVLPNANTRISSTIKEGAFAPKITIRTSSDTRFNSDIFIVALPYDGMIKPFTHDTSALQIFKSVIRKSDKFTINHEDHQYRRVAYFIVRPHHDHLGNDGWYGPECDLVLTFAQSNRTRNNQPESELNWTFKTVRVNFGANGMYEITSSEETAPYDTFNPDDIRTAPICELVQPTLLHDEDYGTAEASAPRRDNNGGKKSGKRK